MMKRFEPGIASAIGALALMIGTSAAAASVITYDTQGGFNAASGPTVTEDFNDTTLLPGLSFVSNAGSIGSGRFNDRVFRGGDQTRFNFASKAKSFGGFFDFSPGGNGQGLSFSIVLLDNSIISVGQVSNLIGFYGFVSDAAFKSVIINAGSFSGSAETYNLDNLRFSGAVPEPSAWALMIGGFGLVGFALRRRQAAAAV